jgi:hypothetical protein
MPSSVPVTSAPSFTSNSENLPGVVRISRELDTKAVQCLKTANCEHIYDSKASVGLSPLARSSQLWLSVVDHDEMDADDSSMRDIAAFVPGIEHRLTEPANLEKLVLPATVHDPAVEQARVVHGMLRQLRERERQIEVLRGQLQA